MVKSNRPLIDINWWMVFLIIVMSLFFASLWFQYSQGQRTIQVCIEKGRTPVLNDDGKLKECKQPVRVNDTERA